MPNHGLMTWWIAVPEGLGRIDDASHILLLLLRQLDIPRRPILLQPVRFRRARDGDHALRSDPSKGDLSRGAPLLGGELLDLLDDGLVSVEVLALKLGD
jgi:hypothetical protein